MKQINRADKTKDACAFTHGGKFHADDVFSSALLLYINPEISITRGNSVPDDFIGIVFDIGVVSLTITRRTAESGKTVCRMRHLACCGRLLEWIF